ncbi:MAG: OmpA family protein [Bacteroidales bacterium]
MSVFSFLSHIKIKIFKYIIVSVIAITGANAFSQDIPKEEKKLFTDTLGNIYVNTELELYLLIADDNDSNEKFLLESSETDNALKFKQHGLHTISHKDAKTNSHATYELFADGVAPNTNIVFNEGLVMKYDNRYYCDSLSVISFNPVDEDSGVSHTYFAVNSDNYKLWDKEFIELKDEVEVDLSFYSVDNVGNIESANSIRIIFDTKSIISLEEIYFGLNSAELTESSEKQLDELAKSLKEFPELRIQLMSHTDSRGTASYNLRLSLMRAESVKNYLISKGIDASRLEAKGFGDTMILNECVRGVECSEEEHQINRRTEFKILPFKK